jgi:hypothetical protein
MASHSKICRLIMSARYAAQGKMNLFYTNSWDMLPLPINDSFYLNGMFFTTSIRRSQNI